MLNQRKIKDLYFHCELGSVVVLQDSSVRVSGSNGLRTVVPHNTLFLPDVPTGCSKKPIVLTGCSTKISRLLKKKQVVPTNYNVIFGTTCLFFLEQQVGTKQPVVPTGCSTKTTCCSTKTTCCSKKVTFF